jgi:hypothetical protein
MPTANHYMRKWRATLLLLGLLLLGALVYLAVDGLNETNGTPGHLPTTTYDVDPVLGIPAVVVRPNNAFLRPYLADRKGLKVSYVGDSLMSLNPDMLYSPAIREGRTFLPWQTSDEGAPGLYGVFPGNQLTILDDALYDFGVGLLMVRARLDAQELEGFLPLATVICETMPADNSLWPSRYAKRLKQELLLKTDKAIIYTFSKPKDENAIQQAIDNLGNPSLYASTLSGGKSDTVHPVYAANLVYGLLLKWLAAENNPQLRDDIKKACVAVFDNYFFINVDSVGGGASWPFEFTWVTNWGVSLKAPWYSAYASSVTAGAASIMFGITKEERFRDLALQAARFVGSSNSIGGAEYNLSGFRLPAEYVYNFTTTPNIRVLDGEIITAIALYNTAILLNSQEVYEIFVRQAFSLAMALEYFQKADGSLVFAAYYEDMPEHYLIDVWKGLLVLANITKDRNFKNFADQLEKHIPPQDIQTYLD